MKTAAASTLTLVSVEQRLNELASSLQHLAADVAKQKVLTVVAKMDTRLRGRFSRRDFRLIHDANLLEVLALVLMAFWGWRQGVGWIRFALALGLPFIAAAI